MFTAISTGSRSSSVFTRFSSTPEISRLAVILTKYSFRISATFLSSEASSSPSSKVMLPGV